MTIYAKLQIQKIIIHKKRIKFTEIKYKRN